LTLVSRQVPFGHSAQGAARWGSSTQTTDLDGTVTLAGRLHPAGLASGHWRTHIVLMSSTAADAPSRSVQSVLGRGQSTLVDARSVRALKLAADADDAARKDANGAIAMGLGIGAFGAASLALVGATCPLCVVAAPALVSWGLYKRVRARKKR